MAIGPAAVAEGLELRFDVLRLLPGEMADIEATVLPRSPTQVEHFSAMSARAADFSVAGAWPTPTINTAKGVNVARRTCRFMAQSFMGIASPQGCGVCHVRPMAL